MLRAVFLVLALGLVGAREDDAPPPPRGASRVVEPDPAGLHAAGTGAMAPLMTRLIAAFAGPGGAARVFLEESVLFSALLTALLYLLPMGSVAQAEARAEVLLGQLAVALQAEDRRRVAKDLHDGAGQAITAARLQLLALRRHSGGETETALGRIATHLDEALGQVRRSAWALASPAQAELGLRGALERHCESFGAASGLRLRCGYAPALPPLPPAVEIACYRIVQEALTKIARHAGATAAWVRLDALPGTERQLRLEVGDDGAGPIEPEPAGPGRGLLGIRERAQLLGGSASLEHAAGAGTCLRVTLPLREPL